MIDSIPINSANHEENQPFSYRMPGRGRWRHLFYGWELHPHPSHSDCFVQHLCRHYWSTKSKLVDQPALAVSGTKLFSVATSSVAKFDLGPWQPFPRRQIVSFFILFCFLSMLCVLSLCLIWDYFFFPSWINFLVSGFRWGLCDFFENFKDYAFFSILRIVSPLPANSYSLFVGNLFFKFWEVGKNGNSKVCFLVVITFS